MPKPLTKQQLQNAITQKRGKPIGNSPVSSSIERAGAIRKNISRRGGDYSQSGLSGDIIDRRSTEFSVNSDKEGENQIESNLNEDIDDQNLMEEEEEEEFDDRDQLENGNKPSKYFKGQDNHGIDEESDDAAAATAGAAGEEEDAEEIEGNDEDDAAGGNPDDDDDDEEEEDEDEEDEEDAEENHEDDAEDGRDDDDENDIDEEEDDISQQQQQQGEPTRKKGSAGSASAVTQHIKSPPLKAGKKNSRRQIKKPGKRGGGGAGAKGRQASSNDEHHRSGKGGAGVSSNQSNSLHLQSKSHEKRCYNQFCKYPFKGELKRVKIKFTQEYVHLCTKCTERFKLKKFCLYCGQVYYDSNEGDGKVWIECGDCKLWLHQECEVDKGCIKGIEELLEDDNYKFYCLRCRSKSKSSGGANGSSSSSFGNLNPHDKLSSSLLKASQQVANFFQSGTAASDKLTGEGGSYSTKGLSKRPYKKQQKGSSHSSGLPTTATATASGNSSGSSVASHLLSQQKKKGKSFITNFNTIKNQLFVPKPDAQASKSSAASHHQYSNGQSAGSAPDAYEPKRSKKHCNEDSKHNYSPSGTGTPQYSTTQQQSNYSTESYSLHMYLNAKKVQKQKEQLRLEQEQQSLEALRQQYALALAQDDVPVAGQDEENRNEQSSQTNMQLQSAGLAGGSVVDSAGNATNNAAGGQNGRQRKDETINFIELPYKKQTVKETTSKKMYYHYSILQELLTPFSLSMTLTQEDINEDLQVYRSIALDGKRNIRSKEDVKKDTKKEKILPDVSPRLANNNGISLKEQPSQLSLNSGKTSKVVLSSPQLSALAESNSVQLTNINNNNTKSKGTISAAAIQESSNRMQSLSPPRSRSHRNSEDCSKQTMQALQASPIKSFN